MMMMSSNSIGTTGGGNGLNDPKFSNWNNRFQKILQKNQGLYRFQKLYTELQNGHLQFGGGATLAAWASTSTDQAANEIRWTYDAPTKEAITDIKRIKLALKDMEDGTVDDAGNQKILEENNLTQYKDSKFTKADVQKIAKESLEAWELSDKKLADEKIFDPDRASVKREAQSLITTKNALLKELQYGKDGKAPVVNVSTDAAGKQSITPLYDENVIDPTTALKVTRLQQLITAVTPYEEALKSKNQDAAIDEILKPKQDAVVALANKLKTIKDSTQYRDSNGRRWFNPQKYGESNWFWGKDISKKNGYDEIFEESLSDINQVYASISGANIDSKGNLVGGFLKSGKSGTVSDKEASFSLDQLENLSLGRNGKPIVVESFADTKTYVAGPELKNKEGVSAKIWLPKDETIEASEGITFNDMPVIVTKDANGKLLARVIDITKAGNGTTITQMPLNFDPKKAKGEDGKYKLKLTQDDMLPPNKGESVRLFTYAFNSQGEPVGNVVMTPSPAGLPKTFNELPRVVKAKIAASSYADPITFPPTAKLAAEQTTLTSIYNADLALLEGASAPPASVIQSMQPAAATTQQPAAGAQQPQQQQPVYRQPIFPAPQLPQQPSVSTPVPQPVQPVVQPTVIAPAVAPVHAPAVTPQTVPAQSPAVAPRRVLAQPDLEDITHQQVKALGWE
ncbi:MAG: hypothetical protein H2174_00185 [Vampirovibrio sp.]|nr:hypothetical protein [Vampirovibrio sp.]